jgi:type II secretory pathway component PulF
MPEYAYKAARADGAMISGKMEADDEIQLAANLQQSGLYLIEARQDYWLQLQKFFDEHTIGRLSRRELVEFCNNLAVMLKAGVPLTRSLEELGSDSENKTLKRALERVNRDILAGSTFTQALHKRRVFPELFCNLVEIGEHSGNLDAVLRDLAEHYKKIDDLIRNTRKALIYPAFILLALVLAAYVFLTMVFPPLFELLEQFKVPLPTVTRVVMAVSDTLKQHGFLYLALAVGGAITYIIMRRYHTPNAGSTGSSSICHH